MRRYTALLFLLVLAGSDCLAFGASYPVVDTGQTHCFGNTDQIACPSPTQPFSGQDAQYQGNKPSYRDNGDGTVTDQITGLMWQKTPDFKLHAFDDAAAYANALRLGGYSDWRVPSIKELLSIVDFRGNMHTRRPYLNTAYFDFRYPDDLGLPVRDMDAQYWSSNEYVGEHIDRRAAFGFNFADGRIKAYPVYRKKSFIRCVRGSTYGENSFTDNGNGTVTDAATGLTWAKTDSGRAMTWRDALAYARSSRLGGYSDWRLPNIKELQSLVDYSRSPTAKDTSRRGPAIDPVFQTTDPEAWFWSSTTHLETGGGYYICFGRGTSAMKQDGKTIDIHGAGALRSDPKSGDSSRWKNGRGPQSDEIRIDNYVRLVRGGEATPVAGENNPVTVGHSVGNTQEMGRSDGPGKRRPGGEGQPVGQGLSGDDRPPGKMGMGMPPAGGQPPMGQGRTRPPGGRDFLADHDSNGDGVVTRQEFKGPPEHFDLLDRNGDGVISGDEIPHGPPR